MPSMRLFHGHMTKLMDEACLHKASEQASKLEEGCISSDCFATPQGDTR